MIVKGYIGFKEEAASLTEGKISEKEVVEDRGEAKLLGVLDFHKFTKVISRLTNNLDMEGAAGLVAGWVGCCVCDGNISNWEKIRWGKSWMNVD